MAPLNTKRFDPQVPITVRALFNLHPGERITYYIGNLEHDIKNCAPSLVDDKGAPDYQDLLVLIRRTAVYLALKGKVTLGIKKIRQSEDSYLYFAVGR